MLPAILDHLRHERETITEPLRIECGEYFEWSSYLDEITPAQLSPFHITLAPLPLGSQVIETRPIKKSTTQ